MLESFLTLTKAVANQAQQALAQQAPSLAQDLDFPQRQRFLELLARGFETFVHGLARATREGDGRAASAAGPPQGVQQTLTLGPRPSAEAAEAGSTRQPSEAAAGSAGPADPAEAAAAQAARIADDEAFAKKFAQLFLDMGGIYPKLAQVLSMRPDLIKNQRVLLRLRCVQEECARLPFAEAEALVRSECAEFREGRCQLRDWPKYIHAGSVAQVAPFVREGNLTASVSSTAAQVGGEAAADGEEADACGIPDGIVKLSFAKAKEVMAIDFRLLRSQIHWMERTGHWTGVAGLEHLRPKHLGKLKEVWRLMVGMEDEVLKEFDLRGELECQQRGAVVIDSLVGESALASSGESAWLEEWRDGALTSTLRPAGATVADHARDSWRRASQKGELAPPRPGLLTRMARRAYAGKAMAESIADGEEHLARLRSALARLKVRVPEVYPEACSEHVLSMGLAEGRSLKEVLDVIATSPKEQAEKAAAWFSALLLFVIVPLWGKMLLVMGCCHADPHPGNFKVDGIPGLEEVLPQPEFEPPARRRGLLGRLVGKAEETRPALGAQAPLTLWVLDWGSCVDVEDGMRRALCKLLVSLSSLRAAQRRLDQDEADEVARAAKEEATRAAADCIRCLGVQAGSDQDGFLAALGMALFDPSVASSHPELRGGKAEELGRNFPAGSSVGKILRVVAILVGVCRELETRMNEEAAGRMQAADRRAEGGDRPFVDLFLVDLWRPFAEEGLEE